MAFEVDSTTPSTIVNSSVGRTREYLTGAEVEGLMAAARKSSRYGHRDATMILIRLPKWSSGLRMRAEFGPNFKRSHARKEGRMRLLQWRAHYQVPT